MFKIIFSTVSGIEIDSICGFDTKESAERYLNSCTYTGIAFIEEEVE